MTNKLSEKQGGGLIYEPGMMLNDGVTGSYYSKTFTSSGNKQTTVLRFNRSSFTGTGAYEFFLRINGNSGYFRTELIAFASDYSDSTLANRIRALVANSSGTNICILASPTGYLDGNDHTIMFSFDGDAGTAQFIIDGTDADDTGYSGRTAPTTGTLDTGASSGCYFGAAAAGALPLAGNIGFFGSREAYITNWQDFMDADGRPKALDESGWTEWGAQPQFWHPTGLMQDNLGSAGAMTKNGGLTLDTSYFGPHSMLGLPTPGTAVAANITSGKTAWVDGVKITGTL